MLTLLDTQHLDLPELFPRGERLFRRLAYDRAARRADQVVVISDWVKERVVERLGVDSGARSRGAPRRRPRSASVPTPRRAREPFLLYPARPWPHKNHERLFEAFALLRHERPELRLVLTGVGHDATRLPDGVEARGGVSHGRAGRAVPPRGCARVSRASTRDSGCRRSRPWPAAARWRRRTPDRFPRSSETAAVLFDPTDVTAIADGVVEALDRAAELSALGLERAAGFTWDATARAHDRVYELAAGV